MPAPRRLAAAVAAGAALAAAAPAARAAETLPPGSEIAGVAVDGLGPRGAAAAVRDGLAGYERPVVVRVKGLGRRALAPVRAGQQIDYDGMVRIAFDAAAQGRVPQVALRRRIDGRRLSAAVRAVAGAFHHPARNASVRWGIARVRRVRHRSGRYVDAGNVRRAVLAELREPSGLRVVQATPRPLRPRITLRELPRIHHTFVSVNRRTFTVRLFKRLRVVRRFRVAVGAAGYATPAGLHRIVAKRRNPTWYVPNRPWAGDLAGKVIPPGPRNPLKARFLAIGGGVGFHGTADTRSIGRRASHGCIRMRIRDVKLLYSRVPVGTPVLIR